MELPFAKKAKPFVFLKEVRTELSKVSWPSKEQTIRLSLIVIAATVVAALFLGAFDLLFTNLAGLAIRK
ncbi:MAG TPA: preprotein translocase subunit SecE [Patescibacteria group bacterium]|nr:preprotein translocase subunit SecE [Patescibacteria group bacterium]